MKRILYSNVTKLIAFVLCAVFAASSVYLLSVSFIQDNDVIYLFEPSYEESYMAKDDLRSAIHTLFNAAMAVQESDYIYSEPTYTRKNRD